MNKPHEIDEETQVRLNVEMNLQRQIGGISMVNAKLQARTDVLSAKVSYLGQALEKANQENEKLKKENEELKVKLSAAPPELANLGAAASLGTQPPHPEAKTN